MPCTPGLSRRDGDTPGTGCRADCLHRAQIERYRQDRAAAAEQRRLERELATHGHATEQREWDEEHGPLWQLREWLKNQQVNEVNPEERP